MLYEYSLDKIDAYYDAGQENLRTEAMRTATALHAPDQLRQGGSRSRGPVVDDKQKINKLAHLGKGKAVTSG